MLLLDIDAFKRDQRHARPPHRRRGPARGRPAPADVDWDPTRCWRDWATTSTRSCSRSRRPPRTRSPSARAAAGRDGDAGHARRRRAERRGQHRHRAEPDHAEDADTLLQRADMALDRARARRGRVEVYSPEHDRSGAERLALLGEVRPALERGEFVLFYQPQARPRTAAASAASRRCCAGSIPSAGMVAPLEFISLIEQTALVGPVTLHVIELALRTARGVAQGRPAAGDLGEPLRAQPPRPRARGPGRGAAAQPTRSRRPRSPWR